MSDGYEYEHTDQQVTEDPEYHTSNVVEVQEHPEVLPAQNEPTPLDLLVPEASVAEIAYEIEVVAKSPDAGLLDLDLTEAEAYAFEKTNIHVTPANLAQTSPEDVKLWEDAMNEFLASRV